MDSDSKRLPLVVTEAHTRDPSEHEAWLEDLLGPLSYFKIDGDRQTFASTNTLVSFGDVAIARADASAFSVGFELHDSVLVSVPVVGSGSVSVAGSEDLEATRDTAVSIPPGCPVTLHHGANAVSLCLLMPVEAVRRQMTTITGSSSTVSEGVDLVRAIDLAGGAGAALSRNLIAAYTELVSLANAGMYMVATSGMAEYLISLALVATFPAARELIALKQSRRRKPAFEMAVEYLTVHAAEHVSLAALADDLGVSLRTLQLEFQKRLGRTPLEFLFDRRLELARNRLLTAGAGATVSGIATQSGFTNLGAFAARYREAFGELPSESLARALGRLPRNGS